MSDYVVIFVSDGKLEAIQGPNTNKTFTAGAGEAANGLAAIEHGIDGLYVSFPVDGATKATYTPDTGIPNANLTYTAVAIGPAGNNVRVRYNIAGASQALSVTVAGNDISVNLATNGSSVPTSTAAQIKTAVEASAPASALVTVANAASNDGTGVPGDAIPYVNLGGGTDGGATASQVTVAPAATPNPGVF